MPKKSKEINPFDGGLNNFSDPRDIEDNELSEATNVKTDRPGRIRVADRIIGTTAESNVTNLNTGKGLFQYSSDYNASNQEVHTEYELLAEGQNLHRKSGSSFPSTPFDTFSSEIDPSFFVADGGVRLSDGNFTEDVQYYGSVKRRYLGSGSDTISMVKTDAYIDPPTSGSFNFNPSDAGAITSTAGTLNLVVDEKTSQKSRWFDTSDFTANAANNEYLMVGTEQSSFTHDSYTITSPSGSGGVLRCSTTASTSIDYSSYRLNNGSDGTSITAQDFTDKSIFVSVWIDSTDRGELRTSGLKFKFGNDTHINSPGNAYIYNVATSKLTAGEWTELEFEYGAHDEVEGEINSTSIDSLIWDINKQNSTSVQKIYFADFFIGTPSKGIWNGRFKFYYSWIYDNNQESGTYELSGQTSAQLIEDKILNVYAQAKEHASGGFRSGNRRITGANVYYAEFDVDGDLLDEDKKFLMEVDLENGIKKASSDTYTSWSGSNLSNGARSHGAIQITDPPQIDTFSTKAGYDEDDKLKKVQYGSSVVFNRRSYVGNVKVTDKSGKTTIYSDRVYKSEPNMFDVFTRNGYIDVAVNDGDEIKALSYYQDFLLQFKKRSIHLINVTNDIEYLEDSYEFRGVWSDSAVCRTDKGVVWVNEYGCFLFDGDEVTDLLAKKIDREFWNDLIGSVPVIGYKPKTQDVVIFADAGGGNGIVYNFLTESFTKQIGDISTNLHTTEITNLITMNDGDLRFYSENSSSGGAVTLREWDAAGTNDAIYINVSTKDDILDDPAQRKTLKKVYLTYSGSVASSTAGGQSVSPISMKYGYNNTSTKYDFSQSISTASDSTILEATPSNSDDASNRYSFKIHFEGNVKKDFEINDINLVYREKALK